MTAISPSRPDQPLHGLWSLWDIMQKLRADFVCDTVEQITTVMAGVKGEPNTLNEDIPEGLSDQVKRIIEKAIYVAASSGLPETARLVQRLENEYRDNVITHSRVSFQMEELFETIRGELNRREVLIVDAGDGRYYDKEALFGRAVFDAFPSARDDIKEAGNCLACGRATAVVFHLMRCAEIGLRVLAWDRRVKFVKRPHVPIEYRQWEEILTELERKERKIEQFPVRAARDAQFAFYHGAMVELRAFKNLYRNRTAHPREIYDMHQARSAMQHVTAFMEILAERLTEKKRTPEQWRKP